MSADWDLNDEISALLERARRAAADHAAASGGR